MAGLDVLLAADRSLSRRAASASEALFALAGPGGPRDPERHRQRNAVLALRRGVHNRRPLDRGALDTAAPLLPGELRETLRRLEAARLELEADTGRVRSAYETERLTEAAGLLRQAKRGLFRESVWLAGRSLHRALDKLQQRSPGDWRSEESHVASKIAAYLVRAATKTSPNSLFAATALAGTGPVPAVAGAAGPDRVLTRLNVFEAGKVVACLAADASLRPAVRPRPNPTLRRGETGWSWWQPASLGRETDDEVFLESGENPVLETIVAVCSGGARTWPEVVAETSRASGFSSGELEPFLERLTENGFLLAALEVPTGEPRPLAALARAAAGAGVRPDWLGAVEAVEAAVDALPPAGSAGRTPALQAVATGLGRLPHVRPLGEDDLFRVDAASGFRVTLPSSLVEEVSRAVDTYLRLFAGLYPPPDRSPFASRFLEHVPPGVDVPLLDLYHDVFEPEERRRPGSFPAPASVGLGGGETAYRRLLEHLEARAQEGAREVILSAGELAALAPPADPPRWMCGALIQIAAPGPDAIASPETRIAINALFHGAGLALSRFHELLEPGEPGSGRIAETLRRGWLSLVPEGALPAEITYTHWGRTANAGLRPRLFTHEIELPGDTATPGSEVIPLHDLVVRYEPDRERFRLRSRDRNAEIVPFLSSGVQPEGFVAFLVHLGTQDLMPVAHFPGFDRPGGPVHWPRFTLGRVVLFRERWVFDPETGPPPAAPGTAWFEAVHRWRRRHHLPRRVFVATDRDAKPFYVDLDSPLCADLLRRHLAGGDAGPPGRLTVTEMFPGPRDLWLRDASGGYASEFLIQLAGPLSRGPETGEPRS